MEHGRTGGDGRRHLRPLRPHKSAMIGAVALPEPAAAFGLSSRQRRGGGAGGGPPGGGPPGVGLGKGRPTPPFSGPPPCAGRGGWGPPPHSPCAFRRPFLSLA